MSSAYTRNANGDAFYQGISCPLTTSQHTDFASIANEMIVNNMRTGIPVKTLGDNLTKKMDEFVEKLRTRVRYNDNKHNKMGVKKIISKWLNACNLSEADMFMQWNVNVHALLKLKRITNNEHFGIH